MNLKSIIDTVSKDKNLKKEIVIDAITHALEKSMKKTYPNSKVEAVCDDKLQFKLYIFKNVVESEPEMLDDETEVEIKDARKLDPDVELGDEIGYEITAKMGRIEANLAKQAISDVIKNAESMIAYSEYKDKKGKIVSTTVQNADRRGAYVLLGSVEVFVPRSELLHTDHLKRNQICEFLLKEIDITENGRVKIQLSRTSQLFVLEALKEEVPEIEQGDIEIVACAREPGVKTKIVVDNADPESKNNPVSSCIGMKGYRIQNLMRRIGGERIDVVGYTDDLPLFLQGLLSGVKVRHVKEENNEYHGEVLKEDFAKAIGKEGVNVRLASRIMGKKIVIV